MCPVSPSMVVLTLQVEKSFLRNEGGCRMSPNEKEREQEDFHPKTESHPIPFLHLGFFMHYFTFCAFELKCLMPL